MAILTLGQRRDWAAVGCRLAVGLAVVAVALSGCTLLADRQFPDRCGEGQTECPTSGDCIDTTLLCDGQVYHCESGWDENGIVSDFQCVLCNDGFTVVHISMICDGVNDCPDGADEDPTDCAGVEF